LKTDESKDVAMKRLLAMTTDESKDIDMGK
jgi:hypothetical protein